jgi:hypothetical protein
VWEPVTAPLFWGSPSTRRRVNLGFFPLQYLAAIRRFMPYTQHDRNVTTHREYSYFLLLQIAASSDLAIALRGLHLCLFVPCCGMKLFTFKKEKVGDPTKTTTAEHTPSTSAPLPTSTYPSCALDTHERAKSTQMQHHGIGITSFVGLSIPPRPHRPPHSWCHSVVDALSFPYGHHCCRRSLAVAVAACHGRNLLWAYLGCKLWGGKYQQQPNLHPWIFVR